MSIDPIDLELFKALPPEAQERIVLARLMNRSTSAESVADVEKQVNQNGQSAESILEGQKQKNLLTTRQAADIAGVTTAAVLNWLHAGFFTYVDDKTSGRYLIPEDEFNQYLQDNDKLSGEKKGRPRKTFERYAGRSSKTTSIESLSRFDSIPGAASRMAVSVDLIQGLIKDGSVKLYERWNERIVDVREVQSFLNRSAYTPTSRPLDSGDFLPIADVGNQLNLTPGETRALSDGCQEGEIANHPIGNIRLISVKDAEKFILARKARLSYEKIKKQVKGQPS